MVKTIRLTNHELHKDLHRIAGKIQQDTGEFTSIEFVIEELIKCYKKQMKMKK